jgi:hypothetical protein
LPSSPNASVSVPRPSKPTFPRYPRGQKHTKTWHSADPPKN